MGISVVLRLTADKYIRYIIWAADFLENGNLENVKNADYVYVTFELPTIPR